MCKKLIVLCLALVIAGFCASASASPECPTCPVPPLKVDIVYAPDNQQPKAGWLDWPFPTNWSGPVIKEFGDIEFIPEIYPIAQLEAYMKNLPPDGIARSRSGGWAAVNRPIGISPTGMGFGLNYLKLTINGLAPDTNYKFSLWSFDKRNVWAASSDNPDSKYGCWSTTNPKDWLDTHGYSGLNGEPNGYGPISPVPNPPTGESGMPAGLAALVAAQGGRTFMMAPTNDNSNYVGGTDYRVSFYAPSGSEGTITVYGWLDATDWTGTMLMPLNGFMVIPEPATLALLGLGAVMLRKKH